ncbi:MAG: hypothetical protein Q8R40_06935 [bacterium]|nr:hypothetical protein [bacterium]
MVAIYKRDKARALRIEGMSLNEITEALNAPKSTVRYWCRDIVLPDSLKRRLIKKQKIGGLISAEKLRAKRIAETERLLNEGIKEISHLTSRELFLVGVALYWAEGYRKGNEEFGFTNSDFRMITLMIQWLQEICGVSKERISLRVCINIAHKNRLKDIQRFWSEATKIPLHQFSNPTLIRVHNKKHYADSSRYFGTLRVKVIKGTSLRRKIMGWLEGMARTAER